MPVLSRCEVWSTWGCASGVRQGFIPLSEIATLTTTERTQHDDEGQLTMSKESASASLISTGKVVRLLYSDASFTEWIVWSIDDSSKESRVLRIGLRSVLTTLDTGDDVLSETTNAVTTVALEWKALTPTDIVTKILAFAPSWWTAGTITPTIPVELAPSGWMPLRAFRELVAAIKAQAVACELHYRRNGTTGYYIDLVTAIGSSEPTLDVRTGKNLMGTTRRRDREKHALEVVPLGTGTTPTTIGKAWWECTGKSGSVLTMQQPVTGGDMVAFDDQLNGLYLVDDAGARQQITDSVALTQELTVASAANFTSGRWYRAVADSSGNDLIRLRKAEATAGTVRLVTSSTLDGTTNIVSNPAQREWAGLSTDPPDGWTKYNTCVLGRTTTAGLWLYGGKSCRVSGTVTTEGGLNSPSVSLFVPTWQEGVVGSMWVYGVTLQDSPQVALYVDGVQRAVASVTSAALGAWQRVDVTYAMPGLKGAVRTFFMRFFFTLTTGAGDCYVDSAQIARSDSASPFVEGSNPAKLWALGNQYLTTYSTEPTSYGVTFADLNQWDPTGFPYDTVALGQTASVYDSDLGITTSGRIIELKRDWKNPLASHLTISSRPEEFVSLLTGIAA